MSNQPNPFLEGFKLAPIPPKALAELEAALSELDVTFDNTQVRTHAMGSDVVTDASWTEFDKSSSSRGRRSRRIRRTFVFFHRPETTLPEFSIQARRGVAGKFLLGASARLMGMPTFEMEDEPEFNKKFTVVTSNAESVKTLLVRDVIDALVAIKDADMSFISRGVLFTRHPKAYRETRIDGVSAGGRDQDERLDGQDRVKLIEDAITASAPIADDPDAGRRAADAVEGTFAEEAVKNMIDQGGLVGRAIKKTLITQEMLEQVKTHPIPRTDIPKPVERRAWMGTTVPLFLLAILAVVLFAVSIGIAVAGSDSVADSWWILSLVGLVVLAVFALVLRHRIVRKRIVTHGLIASGRIVSVDKTNTSVNGDVVHKITVHPNAAGGEPIITKMGSVPAKAARRMMERDQLTWALVDPKVTSRGLWVEGWSLEALAD